MEYYLIIDIEMWFIIKNEFDMAKVEFVELLQFDKWTSDVKEKVKLIPKILGHFSVDFFYKSSLAKWIPLAKLKNYMTKKLSFLKKLMTQE